MRLAKGEFFLLLNSDAFPEETAIATLLAYLREHPRVGVVGPRLLNGDGSLQVSCHPFPSPLFAWRENLWLSTGYSRWAHDTVRSVDFLIGACLLVRRATYEEVGGFDETFFMYSEEADWERTMQRHARMTAAGIKVLHFTPWRIRAQPDEVVTTIRATLRTGTPIAAVRTVPSV